MRFLLLLSLTLLMTLSGTQLHAAAAPAQPYPVLTESSADVAGQTPLHEGNDRNWLVALFLCIFLGVLGIHRFYLGYPVWGLIFLFTGGFFGIGYILDLIRIVLHLLGPKRGRYGHLRNSETRASR
ncbi:MAG: TM2 domain-containing protein [Bacteroidetes bacterium]|nr:MAG: TM2 domain-containing protein [Bacteroidota bacterium]